MVDMIQVDIEKTMTVYFEKTNESYRFSLENLGISGALNELIHFALKQKLSDRCAGIKGADECRANIAVLQASIDAGTIPGRGGAGRTIDAMTVQVRREIEDAYKANKEVAKKIDAAMNKAKVKSIDGLVKPRFSKKDLESITSAKFADYIWTNAKKAIDGKPDVDLGGML